MMPEFETEDAAPASWPGWQPPPGLPEPAREVWLAGLGAFSRAQAEGGKAFQALVRQGLTLQTQASQVAQERIAEAAQAAAQPWERISGLSGIFEGRVARALAHLGLPAARDWAALQARVQALEAALQNALHDSALPDDSRGDLHDDLPDDSHAGTPPVAPAAAAPGPARRTAKSRAASTAKPAAKSSTARATVPRPVRAKKSPARAKAPSPSRATSSKNPRSPASP